MKHFLLTLIAVCFLLVSGFSTFSQTTKKKLVKCTENGKIVYRTKCKTKKTLPVTDTEKSGDPVGIPSDGSGTGTGQGRGVGSGSGSGTGDGSGTENTAKEASTPSKPVNNGESTALKIISKPRVEYTDTARTNQVQGTITLRVTFLANGTIGTITPVSGLPDGLTQKAIDAARMIRFEPATQNGKPITVTRQVQYSFTLF